VFRVLFQVGAVGLVLSSLVWLALSLYDVANPPDRELRALVIVSAIMMLPELLYQLRQFFSSGSTLDD
jgi:hypothetical protein